MLTKQLIYNDKLDPVAAKIMVESNKDFPPEDEESMALITSFISGVQSELNTSKRFKQHLICPTSLYSLMDGADASLTSAMIYYEDPREPSTTDPDLPQVRVIARPVPSIEEICEEGDTLMVNTALALSEPMQIDPIIDQNIIIFTSVESYEAFNQLKTWRFSGVEGSFIEQPERVVEVDEIPANKQSVLSLIVALLTPDVGMDDVAKVIKSDNVLSYKLLRILNSPIFRAMNEISSVQEAVIRFGLNNVKKWAIMLSMSAVSDKPVALMRLALTRAIMCAGFADKTMPNADITDIAYTAGLLSTLDAFVDCPLERLFEATALSEQVKQAIFSQQGPLGEVLAAVTAFQCGQWSSEHNLVLMQCYVDAAEEVGKILSAIS